MLSRCLIFRQHPVKMSHLSAGSYCLYVIIHVCCQDVPSFGNTLSRCPIFRQVHTVCTAFMCVVKMSHLSATPCQDVPSFGRFILFVRNSCVLSRCPIFRNFHVVCCHFPVLLCDVDCSLFVKVMLHVLDFVCVCVCVT